MAVFAVLAGICAFVTWSTHQAWGKAVYRIVPSIVLVYYLPSLAVLFGLIPSASPTYDWMRDYLLPFSLFILMVTADIPSVLQIGRKAILMMLFGTAGIVVGGPLAYLVFQSWLPPDS